MGDRFREPEVPDCVVSKKPVVRIEYDSAAEHPEYRQFLQGKFERYWENKWLIK